MDILDPVSHSIPTRRHPGGAGLIVAAVEKKCASFQSRGAYAPLQLVEKPSCRKMGSPRCRGSSRGRCPLEWNRMPASTCAAGACPAQREIFKAHSVLKIGALAGCRKSPPGLFRQPARGAYAPLVAVKRPGGRLHRQNTAHRMRRRAVPALKIGCRFSSVLTISYRGAPPPRNGQ